MVKRCSLRNSCDTKTWCGAIFADGAKMPCASYLYRFGTKIVKINYCKISHQ